MLRENNWKTNYIIIGFWISLVCAGLFYEYLSCFFSLFLFVGLLFYIRDNRALRYKLNYVSITVCLISAFYFLSAFWAIDYGMALIGGFKFLPLPLFLCVLYQDETIAEAIKKYLPATAAILTIVSAVGMLIPSAESIFHVAGRLAGTFQYPNTFALFLLVAEILLFEKEKLEKRDYLVLFVLLIGIVLTGSRTVFVLAVLVNALILVFHKNRKMKWGLGICLLSGVIMIVVYEMISMESGIVERLASISLEESTFVGRFLYFRDAFPVILKQPFGLGFMGYYYVQQSIQTGVYSVMFIHNDFLQILLDIGWIPFLLLVIAVIKSLVNKKISFYEKLILLVMVLHSCFDFNLQFVSMFCLLILFMDYENGKGMVIKKTSGYKIGFAVMGLCCLYMGIHLVLVDWKQNETAHLLYPWNTQNESVLITQAEEIEDAVVIADEILERNEYLNIAYSVKAREAYEAGNFTDLINYKNLIFEIAPFQYEEYEEYCYMLINGISLYLQAGDVESVNYCKEELQDVRSRVESIDELLSELGKKIKDQPESELPEDIINYIQGMEGYIEN